MLLLGYAVIFNLVIGPVLARGTRQSGLKSAEFLFQAWPGVRGLAHAAVGGTGLFGLIFLGVFTNGNYSFFSTLPGMYLGLGIVLGLLAMIIGESIQIRTANKFVAAARFAVSNGQNEPTQEMKKHLKTMSAWGRISLILLVLAAALMIAASWV